MKKQFFLFLTLFLLLPGPALAFVDNTPTPQIAPINLTFSVSPTDSAYCISQNANATGFKIIGFNAEDGNNYTNNGGLAFLPFTSVVATTTFATTTSQGFQELDLVCGDFGGYYTFLDSYYSYSQNKLTNVYLPFHLVPTVQTYSTSTVVATTSTMEIDNPNEDYFFDIVVMAGSMAMVLYLFRPRRK